MGRKRKQFDAANVREKWSRNDDYDNTQSFSALAGYNSSAAPLVTKTANNKKHFPMNSDYDVKCNDGQEEYEQVYPADLIQYLHNLVESNDDGSFDENLVEKCLQECRGQELALCMYAESGRLIESIFAGPENATAYLNRLTAYKLKQRIQLFIDARGSRVLERLFSSLLKFKNSEPESGKKRMSSINHPSIILTDSCADLLSDWTGLIAENWLELAGDRNGAHCIRTLGHVLCARVPQLSSSSLNNRDCGEKSGKNKSGTHSRMQWKDGGKVEGPNGLSGSARDQMLTLTSRALDFNLMKDAIMEEACSLLIQDFILLDGVAKLDCLNKTFLAVALNDSDNIEISAKQLRDKQGSRVWERVVWAVKEEQQLEWIYSRLFQDRLFELSIDKFANFVIQRFIERATSEEIICDIFADLLSKLNEIYSSQRIGIICSLCALCARNDDDVRQKQFIKTLRGVFNCSKKSSKRNFLPSVLCLGSPSSLTENNNNNNNNNHDNRLTFDLSRVKVQGSLLAQGLFQLRRHRAIEESLFEMDNQCLVGMARNAHASHVLEAFMASDKISADSKQKLAQVFKDSWTDLAADRFGSRVFESFWKFAFSQSEKLRIASILIAKNAKFQHGSHFAQIIWNKYDLAILASNPKQWQKSMELREKRMKSFNESFNDNLRPSPKK